ncbi:MAG: creatininase family protein [Sphingomonadales bacterium]
MLLSLATWPEIEAYLQSSSGVVVPIGSTEQHGPMGLIGTDAITAEAIARGIGDTTGALIAPTFNVGRAEHHMAFPGTLTLRRSTMIAALADWVTSLARHGFERIFFINGHGGNVPVLQDAFKAIHDKPVLARAGDNAARPVRCKFQSWWAGPTTGKLCKQLYGTAEGMHATPSEVAITQHVYPHAIKHADLEPRVAPVGPIKGPRDYRHRFPDGRIGSDSSLATPEAGKDILSTAIAELGQVYLDFLSSEQ